MSTPSGKPLMSRTRRAGELARNLILSRATMARSIHLQTEHTLIWMRPPRFSPLLRTAGNTSGRPIDGVMRSFGSSIGLKPAFGGFSARKLPRGCLEPPSYPLCPGLPPSVEEAVTPTAKGLAAASGRRSH